MANLKHNYEDFIGKKYGKLEIVRIFDKKRKDGRSDKFVECVCDCSNKTITSLYNVLKYTTKSCGCLKKISKRREGVLGNKYGRWVVVDDSMPLVNDHRFVKVECSCENKTIKNINLSSLKRGDSKSCGCIKKEGLVDNKTHGLTKHPLYGLWGKIIQRCHNKKSKRYPEWGGRGIKVCKEWRKDAKSFIEWALENGWGKGLQIDRINNDGEYSPFNCRFVTNQVNCLNQRLLKSSNTSGFCGVSYQKQTGKFGASIRYNGKTEFYKGQFKTPEDAALARDKYIIRNNLPHKLNFPELKYWACV